MDSATHSPGPREKLLGLLQLGRLLVTAGDDFASCGVRRDWYWKDETMIMQSDGGYGSGGSFW